MDLTGEGLLAAVVSAVAAAVTGGAAVALLYKVREWSGSHG